MTDLTKPVFDTEKVLYSKRIMKQIFSEGGSMKLKFVFIHGTAGWGSYDKRNEKMPYWGMRGGDLISYLNEKGFECYAASVSPFGSAWDCACELYAQIFGKRPTMAAPTAKPSVTIGSAGILQDMP